MVILWYNLQYILEESVLGRMKRHSAIYGLVIFFEVGSRVRNRKRSHKESKLNEGKS